MLITWVITLPISASLVSSVLLPITFCFLIKSRLPYFSRKTTFCEQAYFSLKSVYNNWWISYLEELAILEYIMLLFIGLIAGTVGALVGLGGGIIIVPLLIGLHSLSPQLAVGTSMVTVVFTGLSSTLTYMKHKRVDYKSGLILFIGSGPGGIIGSWANKFLNQDTFSLYFGIFLIFVSILLMLRDKLKPLSLSNTSVIKRSFTDNDGNTVHYQFPPFLAIFIAFIVGFISGLFGIGGGALLVPAMMLLLHSQHILQ